MSKRRLLKLADVLEADAKNKKGIKFSLHSWGESKDPTNVEIDCGTEACAVGLACLTPSFNRSGLECSPSDLRYGIINPKYGRRYGWKAVTAFFGIPISDANFLFSSLSYPERLKTASKGERAVAKRIRDFVVGKVSP